MTDAGITWTDERVELLKKLWSDGLSASQIAAELGDGVTRNAVIGKVHRLGLSGRGKAKAASCSASPEGHPGSERSKPDLARYPWQHRAGARIRPAAVEEQSVAVHVDEEVVVPLSERVTIMESAGIHVPLAHGRPDEDRIFGSAAYARWPAFPIAAITRGLRISPSTTASGTAALRGPEAKTIGCGRRARTPYLISSVRFRAS